MADGVEVPGRRWSWWRLLVGVGLLLVGVLHHGVFVADRDRGGPVEAQGAVVSCSPQWWYLGLLSSCEVSTPGGATTVSRTRLDGAEAGQPVGLTYADARGSVHDEWRVAQPAPNYGLAVPVSVALFGFGSWMLARGFIPPPPVRRKPLTGSDRYLVGFCVGMSLLSFAGAYQVHGWFVAGAETNEPPAGSAVAQSCERNWRMLGLAWRCESVITVHESGERVRYTFDSSLLTPADIGRPVPVTYTDPGNAAGPASPWTAVGSWPTSFGYFFACVAVILLNIVGLGCSLGGWQTWRSASRAPLEPAERIEPSGSAGSAPQR